MEEKPRLKSVQQNEGRKRRSLGERTRRKKMELRDYLTGLTE